jgi:hypothetical protein
MNKPLEASCFNKGLFCIAAAIVKLNQLIFWKQLDEIGHAEARPKIWGLF